MKDLPRRLLLLVNICVSNIAALVLLALFISPGSFSQGSSEEFALLTNIRDRAGMQFACLASLLLLAANVLYLLYHRRGGDPMRHVLSDAPGGPLMVSRDALEAGLRSRGEAIEDITKLRVTILAGGLKRTRMHAQFHCPEGASIRDLSTRLRRALETRFAELVKLTEGARLVTEIEFSGFAGKLTPRPAEEKEGTSEPGPFTGPKYPIDDDES